MNETETPTQTTAHRHLQSRERAVRAPLCLALAVALGCVGCGLAAPTYDASGTWRVSETVTNASGLCRSNIGQRRSYALVVHQLGNGLEVTAPSLPGLRFSGSVDGTHVDWSGSFPDNGGLTRVTSTDITMTSPTRFSGTARWTWTGRGVTCLGTTRVSGTLKTPPRRGGYGGETGAGAGSGSGERPSDDRAGSDVGSGSGSGSGSGAGDPEPR